MGDIFVIENGTVETVTRGRIEGGRVVVKKGKITAVGKSARVPRDAEVIDASGKWVLPGFVEAHSHAGLVEDGFPSDNDINESIDPVTPHLQALDGFKPTDLGALEAAEAGVTTMFVTPGSANVFCGMGAVVKTWAPSLKEQLVRDAAGMKLATGENPKRTYGGRNSQPKTRMGTAALFRKVFSEAQNYQAKKKHHTRKRRKDKEPFAIDLRYEWVGRLLAGEFPARCHSHRAIDMLTFLRIASEHKFDVVFDHATEAADILGALTEHQVALVIGPTLGVRTKVEINRRSFATVAKAVEAGLTVAVTSDHPVTPMKYLPVYAALAVREGLSPEDALRTITINPAQILGVGDRVGSIEKGKDADLAIWTGDPLDARNRAERVFINGRPVPPARDAAGLIPG